MHQQFKELLQQYEITSKNIEPLKQQLQLTFEQMNRSLFEQKSELEKRRKEIAGKIENAEGRYIDGDIDKDIYQRHRLKFEEQLAEIAKEEQNLSLPLSNQEKFIDFSIEMCRDLSKI